jgi:diguanylate cyclase (GGDEF)-like protein/PAS domain S-box-containing protein
MIALRHRRTAWLFALLVLTCVALLSYLAGQRYVRAAGIVRHTLTVRETVGDVLSLLKDAETGQRGFLLTGDPAFLTPYEAADQQIGARLDTLDRVTGDEPEEAESVGQIRTLVAQKLQELDRTLWLARAGRLAEAVTIVRGGQGRRIMVEVRAEVARMLAREQVALGQREADARRSERGAELTLLVGLGMTLFLVLAGLSTVRRDMAEALRAALQVAESERAFRLLADNSGDLVRIQEVGGRDVYVSPSCEALLGYTPQELLALPKDALLPEDDVSLVNAQTEDLLETSHARNGFVHRLRRKDGAYRWFETHLKPALHQPDGKPRLHLTSRDVTDRRVAEEALRKQTGMFQSILASMGDGVVVLDQDRRFTIINPAARDYIRQEVGEICSPVDWSVQNFSFLPGEATPFPPEQGPLTRALRGESCDNVEIVIHDRAGEQRRFAITSRPIYDYDGRRTAGCVAVYHDVSAQRRAELALIESEQRWRVLSEATFEGLAISCDGKVIDTNANLAAWIGRDPQDVRGADLLALFHPDDHEHVLAQSGAGGGLYEARMVRKDGSFFHVEVRGRQSELHGRSVRISAVRDISERKLREAETLRHAEELRALSLRDELTRVYNRRGFLEMARQQLRVAVRGQRPAALFFADLDGMKSINDGFGHDAGDRAIAAMGTILSAAFRGSDIVARLGGDEFAIFAPECDPAGVGAARVRLQEAVDGFNARRVEPFRLSVSVGSATFSPGQPLELEMMMEAADVDMYREKRAGGLGRASASMPCT